MKSLETWLPHKYVKQFQDTEFLSMLILVFIWRKATVFPKVKVLKSRRLPKRAMHYKGKQHALIYINKKNLSTNLASLESELKVKCLMFRNSWADCCCSSNHLIVRSDFFSSLDADDTTSVNLQNETTEVVCFLVSLRPYHTTTEKFENTALFLLLGLPSTLICHENGAFRKRFSNGGIWKHRLCVLV